MKILEWLNNVLADPPLPLCPECGSEMKPGYIGRNVIVEPLCPIPHPILRIPTIKHISEAE